MMHRMSWPCCGLLGAALALSACGGGGPEPVVASPALSTTLSLSTTDLALSVNAPGTSAALTGTPRTLVITNTGTEPAMAVNPVVGGAPTGTAITSSTCGTLNAGASCSVTITPGNTASAAPGAAVVPMTVTVSGSNTNTVVANVSVLTFGVIHQGGYVFAIDDSTTATSGVGGKVAGLADTTTGVIWSSNGNGGSNLDADYATVPGIDELSLTSQGECNGKSDGACNTGRIRTFYAGVSNVFHAAGTCVATQSGYSDWYLPAICELSSQGVAGCTGSASMQANLIDTNLISLPSSFYWSSTQTSFNPMNNAWLHRFDAIGADNTLDADKSNELAVRCVRALTS